MKLGVRGTGWVSEKNTIAFFTGYATWSEKIRKHPLSSDEIVTLFHDVDKYKNYPTRSKALLRYKILIDAKGRGIEELDDEYFKFIDQLEQSKYWVEQSYDQLTTMSRNTFIAPQSLSTNNSSSELTKLLDASGGKNIARDRSAKIFSRILKTVPTQSPFYGPFNELASKTSHLTDALSEIHHEVTDNIDHWMLYPENQRLTDDKKSLFGDTLALEVKPTTINRLNSDRSSLSSHIANIFRKYPVEFSNYVEFITSINNKKNAQYFIELSYYDNGRGIEENINNFSKKQQSYKNLSSVIFDGQSTRSHDGAGHGFSTMITHSKFKNCLFCLQSGTEIFSVCPSTDFEPISRTAENYLFGTIISILVPIGV